MIVEIDASDFLKVAKEVEKLPKEIQAVALRRAYARTRKVVERSYARFAARHINVAQKHITKRMESSIDSQGLLLLVKSANIPLHEIGAQQRKYGVFVRGRGRYDGAFIPVASSQRAAGFVLRRIEGARAKARKWGDPELPTQMLFGPNPAHAVNRTPTAYQAELVVIAKGEFEKVVLQQVAFLMGGKG